MITVKGYLIRYFSLIFTGLAAIAAINAIVDPINIFRLVSIPNVNQEKPLIDIQDMSRTKAVEMLQDDYDLLLLGNSRVFWGIDPARPAFGDRKAYNAGLTSASIYQVKQIFDYAIEHMNLKTVVIGLNITLFDAHRPWVLPNQAFNSSPFLNANLILANIGSLLSKDTLLYSWNTVQYNRRHQTFDKYTSQGFLNPEFEDIHRTQNFRKLANKMEKGNYQLRLTYSRETVAFLKDIIATCEAENIELKLFIEPTHEVMQAWLEKSKNIETFNKWRQLLTLITDNRSEDIELWDFTGENYVNSEKIPETDEIEMKWYLDPIHYTHFAGDLIMTRLLGNTESESGIPENFGILINP